MSPLTFNWPLAQKLPDKKELIFFFFSRLEGSTPSPLISTWDGNRRMLDGFYSRGSEASPAVEAVTDFTSLVEDILQAWRNSLPRAVGVFINRQVPQNSIRLGLDSYPNR